jgi:transcriptional regulator with XRE-family HTH domain
MAWTEDDRRARDPEAQLGWDIIGGMVKRRRTQLGWTQRDLSIRSGLSQTAICRLETGRLRGLRFSRFARLVAAMGGLDPGLPLVPLIQPIPVIDLTRLPIA